MNMCTCMYNNKHDYEHYQLWIDVDRTVDPHHMQVGKWRVWIKVMHNIEKERHKIFYVETQIRKNHKDEKNNPLVTGFTEMICQSLSVEIFLSKGKGNFFVKRKRKSPSHWRSIYTWLLCVPEGGWYGRDPRIYMICMCRLVVTAMIINAWLLGLCRETRLCP